jgi:hypothetical protein
MELRFSRHARNRLRALDLNQEAIRRVIASGSPVDWDQEGRPRYQGEVDGELVRVVLAVDRPGLVVTVHRRSK